MVPLSFDISLMIQTDLLYGVFWWIGHRTPSYQRTRLAHTRTYTHTHTFFRSSVTNEELKTVVTNVEGIVSSVVNEVQTQLHLLLGLALLTIFNQPFENWAVVDNAVLTRRMRYLKSLSDHYSQRFKEERWEEIQQEVPSMAKVSFWSNHRADNRCCAVVVKTFDGSSSHLTCRPNRKTIPHWDLIRGSGRGIWYEQWRICHFQ